MYTIGNVSTEDFKENFSLIYPYIEKALEYQEGYTLNDVVEEVLEGKAFVLLIHDEDSIAGVCVVKQELYPKKKYLLVQLLAGDGMMEWVEQLRSQLREMAKILKYDGLLLCGRPGWFSDHIHVSCRGS